MKGEIKRYFDWEGAPAILVERDADSTYGFYIPSDGADWVNASNWNVLDWYKDGEPVDRDRFESKFGVIGKDLPAVPSI